MFFQHSLFVEQNASVPHHLHPLPVPSVWHTIHTTVTTITSVGGILYALYWLFKVDKFLINFNLVREGSFKNYYYNIQSRQKDVYNQMNIYHYYL